MKNPFKIWLENQNIETQIGNAFKALGSGIDEQAKQKQTEYAKRILNGEPPEQVMQGIKPNGNTWNLVMQKVQELKNNKNISLSSYYETIKDPNWILLYELFSQQYQKYPKDQTLQQLGQILLKSAQNNNMSILEPFIKKYLGKKI